MGKLSIIRHTSAKDGEFLHKLIGLKVTHLTDTAPKNSLSITGIRCILIPRFNMMTLTTLLEPCRIANYLSAATLYDYSFHSFDGPTVTASSGFHVRCRPPPENVHRDDIAFIFGSWGCEQYQNPKLFAWLRLQARLGARLGAIEIGSHLFARAGLLTGKSATSHWSYLAGFQEQFPTINAV